ncbi:MAG: AAA family ATPase [Planctomycetes bacterium]|nr:AAA family ATPase [Planctomycetota bacterium]
MKITDTKIDGFGVWHDLQLTNLSSRVTVFYGANEAGKTTLMQFIRSVMYGISPERRQRYLPPVSGGKPGGILGIVDGENRFELTRIADRGPDDLGLATITTQDGQTGGDRLLREALSEVDETTFNNIFAIGLREIQELGTLSDSQAAEWLYRLTSGVDRVSLYDVIQNLRQTRHDLLSGKDHKSKIAQLIGRRDALQGEIQQLAQRSRGWAQLAVRIKELDAEIAAKEAELRDCERRARTIEIAVGLKPNWRKRKKIASQLEQFSGQIQLPDDAIERLDELAKKIESHQREAAILEGQRRQLKEESERLGINERLVKASCRIEALGEQRDWLQSLERQTEDLETEAEELEQRLEGEQERLGAALGLADRNTLKEISNADLEGLQPLMQEIRAAQKRVDEAQQGLDAVTENERSLQVKIETAVVGGEQHGLPMDVREASDLVAMLRKRLQVEQRLEQARSHEVEMQQQSQDLLDDQVMPLSVFNWSLAAIVLSGLLLGTWLFIPGSPLGSAGAMIAVGALVTLGLTFGFKFFTEDAVAEKLDGCQRQLEMLARQVSETEKEKKQLDAQLSMTDGSAVLRLQAAERHLAELENILPYEAQRKQAGHEVSSADSCVTQAREQLNKSMKAWRSKLAGLGFSEKLDPERFLTVSERFTALSDLEQRAKLRREDAAQRQREHETITRRVTDLAQEIDCVLVSDEIEEDEDGEQYEVEVNTLDQLEHLLNERRRQLTDIDRRKELSEKAKALKAQEAKHRKAIVGHGRRREALFHAANSDDETAYRRLAEEQQQSFKLKKQQAEISREIAAAIGNHAPEETFADLLTPASIEQLDDLWETASSLLEQKQEELKALVGERGAKSQEQRTMAEDRSLAERQLELGITIKQLEDARQSWREHAVVNRVLERIRSDYEANRQPETLEEASQYMAKLTDGQYQRVWTPLANDVLLVEKSTGESLAVDRLSRGTREQLFLSVRLALVANFARRGIRLPMVLDDVLVNFDAVRTQRAAEVLSEFAAGGHQLLVFTCHEHMWQMFKKLDADCRKLPSRGGTPIPELVEPEPVEEEQTTEPAPEEKPKKHRKPKPVEVVAEEPEPMEFYDYPFVEKIEEEVIETVVELPEVEAPVATETVYEWSTQEEHAPAPKPVAVSAETAIAYIVGDEVAVKHRNGADDFASRNYPESRRA